MATRPPHRRTGRVLLLAAAIALGAGLVLSVVGRNPAGCVISTVLLIVVLLLFLSAGSALAPAQRARVLYTQPVFSTAAAVGAVTGFTASAGPARLAGALLAATAALVDIVVVITLLRDPGTSPGPFR